VKFDNVILKKIIGMGSDGKSFRDIALELNMTPDQLRDEQLKDEKLNDALDRAEFNRDQFMIDTLERNGINKKSRIQKDVYGRLNQKNISLANQENTIPYKNDDPKKIISSINNELENLGYTEATKQDIISCYLRLVQISVSELNSKIKDTTQPAIIRIVGEAILSGKGFDVVEKILDRGIGKPAGSMELTGKDGKDLIPQIKGITFVE
jgi:hypothetical protein